jgi:hypothetical protein
MMKTLYQIRVEGPTRAFDGQGHFFSKRVFVSLERARAFAPGFAERCCGEGLFDLSGVTDTKFIEIELDEEETK